MMKHGGRALALFVLIAMLATLTACATWKNNTVTGYEITGAALVQIYDSGKAACDAGTLKAEQCTKIRAVYNVTRSAYISAGNALIAAINAEDTAKRKAWLLEYQDRIADVARLLPELIALAEEFALLREGLR